MYFTASSSDLDYEYFIPDEDALIPTEDVISSVGEKSVEDYLISIDSNVQLLTASLFLLVTVGFAVFIVYIILKPIFYFFD